MIILVASVTNEYFGSVSDSFGSSSLLGHWSPASDANFAFVALPSRSYSRTATKSDTRAMVMFTASDAKELNIFTHSIRTDSKAEINDFGNLINHIRGRATDSTVGI